MPKTLQEFLESMSPQGKALPAESWQSPSHPRMLASKESVSPTNLPCRLPSMPGFQEALRAHVELGCVPVITTGLKVNHRSSDSDRI